MTRPSPAFPLTSPEGYALSVGLFGMPFATTFFVAAIVLGLLAGTVTSMIERTGWLAGQARMRVEPAVAGRGGAEGSTPAACPAPAGDPDGGAGSGTTVTLVRPAAAPTPPSVRTRWKVDAFAHELAGTARRLALYFLGLAAVGYLLIETVPTVWLTGYLGDGSALAVPLAALLGIPVYLNTRVRCRWSPRSCKAAWAPVRHWPS